MNFQLLKKRILIFAILSLIISLFYFFQNGIKNFFYSIFSPLQRLFFEFSKRISIFFGSFTEKIELKKENERLVLEIKKLIAENESLKELKKENERLREALGIGLEKEFEMKLAKFSGKDFSGDIFKIDKGSRDGIEEGMVVITPEKFLIGKILKVYQNFSKVQVFTDKNFSFDAQISEKEISGLIKGEGNFKAKIQLVPKEKEILTGDKVLTSALGGKFPAGIFVGEIEKVEKSDIKFYQEAELKPAFDLEKIDYLFVILNFK
jgi:rod shape-determining protein MreC